MQGHRSGYVVARFHGEFWKTNDVIFRHEVSAHPFYRRALQVVPASCFIFVKLSRPGKCPCLIKRSGCVYWGEVHSQWVIDKLLWPLEIYLVLGPEGDKSLLANGVDWGHSMDVQACLNTCFQGACPNCVLEVDCLQSSARSLYVARPPIDWLTISACHCRCVLQPYR